MREYLLGGELRSAVSVICLLGIVGGVLLGLPVNVLARPVWVLPALGVLKLYLAAVVLCNVLSKSPFVFGKS